MSNEPTIILVLFSYCFLFFFSFQIGLILQNQIGLVREKYFVLRKKNICLFCSWICADEYLIWRGRKSLSNTKVFFALFHLKLFELFTEYAPKQLRNICVEADFCFKKSPIFQPYIFLSYISVLHLFYKICFYLHESLFASNCFELKIIFKTVMLECKCKFAEDLIKIGEV